MMAITPKWVKHLLLTTLVWRCSALDPSLEEISRLYTRRTERGVHLPIVPVQGPATLERRGRVGSIGLGNYVDVVYNVLVRMGGVLVPVILDTGSSDLWVTSDTCTAGCGTEIPLYPQSSFKSLGLDANLLYGDSSTGTYAFGPIGTDDVNLAGLTVSNQHFAAINNTNTSLSNRGSSGIFGLGFPSNSVLWKTVFVNTYLHSPHQNQRRLAEAEPRKTISDYSIPHFPTFDFLQSVFPDLSFGMSSTERIGQHPARQLDGLSTLIFQSYPTIAPLLGRMVVTGEIDPVFSVTLQRNTVDIGGNVGQLSIGELPPGVRRESLTWVSVRGYTRAQGGLPAPPDSPNEVYPIAWEILIDDIYLDGELLPRSKLSSSDIDLTALIDTGSSLIRGPADVVTEISNRIGVRFPCSEPHTLAFAIGGKLFAVDPRDFISQTFTDSVSHCTANIALTDPPAQGRYLFSWSLGTPFLKGVLSAYHFGDLQYPSRDPPRIGFISTVPEDAGEKLRVAVDAAAFSDGNFPFVSEPAPTGTWAAATTDSNGVPKATEIPRPVSSSHASGADLSSWLIFVVVSTSVLLSA